MKYRKCHVTNSSSSSFVCDICGHVESGWEMSISEAGMYMCVNGHTFCFDEALINNSNKEDLIKIILQEGWNKYEYYKNGEIKEKFVSEEELNEMEWEELMEYASEEGGYYDVPECFCPICNFIEYSESDLSKYLLKEYGVSKDEVFAEIKKYNKRRKKLYNNEYITYVCKKFDLNPIEIVASWKDKFGTYAEFDKYLKG